MYMRHYVQLIIQLGYVTVKTVDCAGLIEKTHSHGVTVRWYDADIDALSMALLEFVDAIDVPKRLVVDSYFCA